MMIFQFIGIQIFTAMYLILILIVYSLKKKFNTVQNDVFKSLLYFTIIELILDIITCYTIRYSELFPILNLTLCKIVLIGYQIWAALLMLYVFLLGSTKFNSLNQLFKESNKAKIGRTIVLILAIITLFLPIGTLYDQTYRISYITGICTTYDYIVTIIYLFLILLTSIINKNKVTLSKRIPIFIFFITAAIFLPIQRFNKDVPVLIVPLMGYAVMIMYFTLENPDLKLINELNKLKIEAEDANKVKSKFLKNVSRDIKNPMNSIIGFSETILMEDINDNARQDAENINSSSKALFEMLNNTINITNIEYDEMTINNNDYNLKNILNKLSDNVTKELSNKNIKFDIKIDSNLPYLLYGDEEKIYDILNNLLSNAVKYTEVGKITLKLDGIINSNELELTFKVVDTGIGIKESDYDKIFEKFNRLSNNKLITKSGTGLGLAITHKMVELLNGTIDFTSVYGGGTTFTVKLKQTIKSNSPIGEYQVIKNEQEIELFDYSEYKVILLADDEDTIKVLKRMLSFYKINLTIEKNIDKALNTFKSNNHYDLILIDLDKYEENKVNIIKSIDKFSNVIGLITRNYEYSEEYYNNKNFSYILNKPFTMKNINFILTKYLKK